MKKKPAKKKSTAKMIALKKKPAKKRKHHQPDDVGTGFAINGRFYDHTGVTQQSNTTYWIVVLDSATPPGTALAGANYANGQFSLTNITPTGAAPDKKVALNVYAKDGGGPILATVSNVDGNPQRGQIIDIILQGV